MPPTSLAVSDSYERVPYISQPFHFSHPDNLAAIGILFGLNPARPSSSSVLELGAASGNNLIPLALAMPESEFLGIDTSARAIEEGLELIKKLNLTNIELRCCDIEQFDARTEQYDYIIAHGVFSWVPERTRTALMELCAKHLAPQGIAYISYNTYPGWHSRMMLRDMAMYHAAQFDGAERLPQARKMLAMLRYSLEKNDAPLSEYLKNLLDEIKHQPDWYLEHELLEETNSPIYFHQFIGLAQEHGLQYLGDAEFSKMLDRDLEDPLRKELRKGAADVVRFEQNLDFLRNRAFRRTLLCRSEFMLSRESFLERIFLLEVGGALRREKASLEDNVRFVFEDGSALECADPFLISALSQLGAAWPQTISFSTLCEQAEASLDTPLENRFESAMELSAALWSCFERGLVELRAERRSFLTMASERPESSPLARVQATSSAEVTNFRHEVIVLDSFSRELVTLLDGSRNRQELALLLQTRHADLPSDISVDARIEEALSHFAAAALLQG